MQLPRSVCSGLALSAALVGFLVPADKAEATVIAYSSLQISNFVVDTGINLIDVTSASGVNTSTSGAAIDGTNANNSSPVNAAPGSMLVADSDVAAACVGACAGISPNNFAPIHAANPGSHFAR